MKFLLLPGPYGFSHATRPLQIGQLLQDAGHEVAVCLNEVQSQLLWENMPQYVAPPFPSIKDYNENVYQMASVKLLQQYVDAELQAIQDFKPDYCIADLRPTAAISAKLAKVPLITIENAALFRGFNPYKHLSVDIPLRQQQQYRANAAHVSAERFRAVAKKRGLRKLKDLFDFVNGDYNWICDDASLFSIEAEFSNYRFIGPLLFEAPQMNTASIPPPFLNNKKPFIYLTLGNTGKKDLMNLYMEAFAKDFSCNVLMTTGMSQETGYEGFISPNVYSTAYVSGAEVLANADVIIHHGGSGTMYQAFKNSVPSIVIPYNIEQKINAMVVEQTETGLVLDINVLTAEHLNERTRKTFQYRKIIGNNLEKLNKNLKFETNIEACIEEL